MQCIALESVRFDRRSREGISYIRELNGFPDLLTKVVALGTFVNIFLGNKVPESTFNISQTDWHMLNQAMRSLSGLQRRLIEDGARYQILDHQSDFKQRKFWEGIANGCDVK